MHFLQKYVGGGKELTVPQYYAAGSLAAIPISIVESPVDFFKIQLQAQVRRQSVHTKSAEAQSHGSGVLLAEVDLKLLLAQMCWLTRKRMCISKLNTRHV